MDEAELRARIASFDRWHYRFDFGNGISTPIYNQEKINRHEQRARYFFDRLLQLTGGSLKGHRVLDLGCNAGYWSLKAADAGADFVFGIDGRQKHVDQSNLVFEAKGVDPTRYTFALGNVLDYPFGEQFDIVLCLGLMYHVSKPIELFEMMNGVGAQIIVLDTAVSLVPGSVFEVRHEGLVDPRMAVDYGLVLVPSRQAVIEVARLFGYHCVPLALNVDDFTGMPGFRNHSRVAFMCTKSKPTGDLPAENARIGLGDAYREMRRLWRLSRGKGTPPAPSVD